MTARSHFEHSSSAMALRDLRSNLDDLLAEALCCRTVEDALRLSEELTRVREELDVVQGIALAAADQLCGTKH